MARDDRQWDQDRSRRFGGEHDRDTDRDRGEFDRQLRDRDPRQGFSRPSEWGDPHDYYGNRGAFGRGDQDRESRGQRGGSGSWSGRTGGAWGGGRGGETEGAWDEGQPGGRSYGQGMYDQRPGSQGQEGYGYGAGRTGWGQQGWGQYSRESNHGSDLGRARNSYGNTGGDNYGGGGFGGGSGYGSNPTWNNSHGSQYGDIGQSGLGSTGALGGGMSGSFGWPGGGIPGGSGATGGLSGGFGGYGGSSGFPAGGGYQGNWGQGQQGYQPNQTSGDIQSHVGRGPRGWKRSDERIREDVNEQLERHPQIDATDIEVRVEDGEVTLSGNVGDRRTKRMAEDVVENVAGVREVQNHIRVKREGGVLSQLFGGGDRDKDRNEPSSSAQGGTQTGSTRGSTASSQADGQTTSGAAGSASAATGSSGSTRSSR